MWSVKVFLPVSYRLMFRADIGKLIEAEKAYSSYGEETSVTHGFPRDERLTVWFQAKTSEQEIEQWLNTLGYIEAAHLHPTRVVRFEGGKE